jgi:hypothetical protein
MDVRSLFIKYIYTGCIGVNNKKCGTKSISLGNLRKKKQLIVNEFIFSCYFNTVIKSLGSWDIVHSLLGQALYLTKQHYRRTVSSGEDNNGIILTVVMTYIYRHCDGHFHS